MNYSEKLKDPRWQKKRLEILNRDNWKCQKCFKEDKTLHVHHRYYLQGKDPWEIPIDALVTLCFECHEEEEYAKQNVTDFIRMLQCAGFFNTDLGNPFQSLFSNLIQIMGVVQFDLLITRMALNGDVLTAVYKILDDDKKQRDEKNKNTELTDL